MRKPLIAANWKMYKNPTESTAFLTSFFPLIKNNTAAEIVLCPSMTSLPALVDAARGKSVYIGAQTMHWLNDGAYTGETSPTMLTAIGVTHVLIGHSERRQYFNETDTTVNLKLKSALAHGLIPIVCVGEHLTEREAGLTANVLELQTSVALEGIDPADRRTASSSPTSPSGPSAPAAPPPPRSPKTPTRSSAPRSPNPSLQRSPPAPASSTAAPSNPTTPPASAASKTSMEPSSAEPASTPPPSPRSSPTPPPS